MAKKNAANVAVVKTKTTWKQAFKRDWQLYLLLLFPLIMVIVFSYGAYPGLRMAFMDYKPAKGYAGSEWVGMKTFIKIFKDADFMRALRNSVVFNLADLLVGFPMPIILALILNMKFKGRRFLRTIVLIPWAMPAVVAGMAAKWAFNNDYGLINDFIRWFVPGYQNSWLINTGTARAAVIAMDLWKDLPFFAILVLSGLQFISGDIYEAAKVDGANGIQSFFRITLPLIAKNVLTLCIPFTLWRLTTFDLVYSMTSGGPGEDTALIAYRITTEAFTNLNVGYASALAMLLFVVMAIFSWLNIRVMSKFDS